MIHFLIALMSCLDIGTYGEVFPVQEEDLTQFFQRRLKKSHMEDCLIYPKAKRSRIFEFDPSICLAQDVKNHHGDSIIPKGAKVNPLDITHLTEDLLFLDGNDPLQVAWAEKERGMWVLINGKPLDIKYHSHVYFDHSGYLPSRLGIASLPAKVSQKHKKLLIEEVPCF